MFPASFPATAIKVPFIFGIASSTLLFLADGMKDQEAQHMVLFKTSSRLDGPNESTISCFFSDSQCMGSRVFELKRGSGSAFFLPAFGTFGGGGRDVFRSDL